MSKDLNRRSQKDTQINIEKGFQMLVTECKLKPQHDSTTSQNKRQSVANVDKDMEQLNFHTPQVEVEVGAITLEKQRTVPTKAEYKQTP